MEDPYSPRDENTSTVQVSILLLCLLSVCVVDDNCLVAASDTIAGNQSLSGDHTLESSGGSFELGFFQPGNSPYYYIGIWYGKVNQRTIVWVANRDNPVEDKDSTRLEILGGNLVLVNGSKVPAWSTTVTSSPSSLTGGMVIAVLGDDGNLMLKSGSNSSSTDAPLWQSFDHPAHTFLPGARLGINKRTNESSILTSWKNADDPAVGLYSLQLQPSSEYNIFWNMSEYYWTSGVWDSRSNIFSLVPEMRLNYIFNFSYVNNENGSYFTYSMYPSANTISRLIIDTTGQIKQLSWLAPTQQWNLFWSQPRQQCEVYRLCGPYGICSESTDNFCSCLPGFSVASPNDWNRSDWSAGCTRTTNLNCGANFVPNLKEDGFLLISNIRFPDGSQSLSARSFTECESSCLNDCSCVGFALQNGSCSVWKGKLFNLRISTDDLTGERFYLRVAASEITHTFNKTNVAPIVGISVVGAVVIVVIVLLGIWLQKRRSMSKKTGDGILIDFAYRELQVATENFSDKLGGGDFGSVFKGTLSDSSQIAVKKLESISHGERHFRAEVSIVGSIQHVNLVSLRGFCCNGNKKLLVNDYVPNGSLVVHLFNEGDQKVLDWRTRYQIALGAARGLAYLHEKCMDCIIHCDIKPENILLDAEFVPKVADFGLAKIVGPEFRRVLMTMRGMRRYLAPEWISEGDITAKADVYSYGMLLFEIVSGRRNSEPSSDRQIKFFPTWAATKVVEGGDLLDLLDARLDREADVEELRKICKVACWCIQDDEARRPKMVQVVQILEGVVEVNMPPVPKFGLFGE